METRFKSTIAVSAIFALTAIGILACETVVFLHHTEVEETAIALQTRLVIGHLNATLTDLDRTVQIAGGAINEARQIERDNRKEIGQVNQQTVATLQHLDALIVSIDATQKTAGESIASTSSAIGPVMEQTRKDLADLEPAIQQVDPLLLRLTDVAVNLSNSTADVAHEIHKFVYPPPRKWYQKYILDPTKFVAHMLTIPLTSR